MSDSRRAIRVSMGFMSGLNFDLMDQLVFYGSYHKKPWNQFVHFIFVPLIMWSVAVWLAYAGLVTDRVDLPSYLNFLPPCIAGAALLNYAAAMMLAYALYYMTLEPFAGFTWALVLGAPMWVSATYFFQHVPRACAWALGAHLLGWFMQIEIGHILIEHKRPALLDSFFQSLVLAGLFAWMEGLFKVGYRPKLQAELNRRIGVKSAEDTAYSEGLLDPKAIQT